MSTLSNCTSSTRPASPATGDTLFETDTKKIIVWNGSNWYVYNYDDTTAFSNTLSLSFDGSNDFLTTTYTPSNSTAFSYSFWTKSSDITNSMSWMATSPFSGNGGGFRVITPSGTKAFYVLVANGAGQYLNNNVGGTDASLAVRDGSWHHLVFSISGTAIKIWIDGGSGGSPTHTDTSTVSYVGNVTQPLIIGRNGGHSSYYFNGGLDEIATFEYELSATQVANIYNSGVPNDVGINGLNLSPSSYFRCGDGSSDTNSSGGTPSNADSVGTVTSIVNSYTATQSTTSYKPTYSNNVPS